MSFRNRKIGGDEYDVEILPMMNLFVVLIPMLLLSAVFVELSVIRLGLPSDEPSAAVATKEPLGLAVAIEDDQWIVRTAKLPPTAIPRDADGSIEKLRVALGDIGSRFPDNRDVVIVSRPHTRYEDIISVMDVSRDTGLENVSLSGAGS
jgi:biopolymer transport protein ExbD